MMIHSHEGDPPVTGGFPSQRPVTQSFSVFFDLRQHKRLGNRDTGDLRRHRANYDVTVILNWKVKHVAVLQWHLLNWCTDDIEKYGERVTIIIMDLLLTDFKMYILRHTSWKLVSYLFKMKENFKILLQYLLFVSCIHPWAAQNLV